MTIGGGCRQNSGLWPKNPTSKGPYKKDGPDGKGQVSMDPGRMTSNGSTTTRQRIVPFAAGAIGA